MSTNYSESFETVFDLEEVQAVILQAALEGNSSCLEKLPSLISVMDDVDGGSKLRRGGVSRRSDFAAHRCVALKNRENGGFSHHLSQIRREAQECTLTWSFGPRFVAVC